MQPRVWAAIALLALPSPAMAETVAELRAKAANHFRAGRYAEALTVHRAIGARVGAYPQQNAFNDYRIARCLDKLGKRREAALTLVDALSVLREVNQRKARRRLKHLREKALGRIVARCSRPGVRVTIEGIEPVAQRCGTEWDLLEPGQYTLFWRGANGLSRSTTLQVRAGRLSRAVLRLEPQPVVSDTIKWSLAGGAAASLALSGAFYALGRDALDDGDEAEARFKDARTREERMAALDDAQAADDELGTWRLLTYTFLGAGVALAGATTWAFLAKSDPSEGQVAVQPQIGPGWLGATVTF